MAYKFQEGAANYDGEVSGSSFRTAGSLSGSGDLAVTGNMHAAQYYGGGGNLTGISADTVDVDEKDDNVAYQLVGVAAAGSDVTLVADDDAASKFTFNPSSGLLSGSKAQFTGASVFGAALNVTGASTLASTLTLGGKLSSSAAMEIVGQVDIVGSLNVTGSSALNGGIDVNGSLFTAGADGAVTMTSLSVLTGDIGTFDAISGSGTAQFGGATILGSTLNVTGAVVAKSTISASGVSQLVSSISSSGDLAVTGNVHAAQFYGGGAGITGISSDAVDVTASLGASLVYGIVGTQAVQSDGTLGLITTVSGASFNPLDAAWGSKLLLSGNVSGLQRSSVQFGEKAGIGIKDDDGYILQITSSEAGIDISASQDAGIAIYGGDGEEAGVGIYGSLFAVFDADDDDMYKFAVESANGAVSGAAGAQFVGASIFGNNLSVSGTFTSKGDTQLADTGVGTTVNGDLTVVEAADFQDEITAVSLSGSSTLQMVGATILGGTLWATGAVDFASTLEVTGVYNHGYQRYEMTTITSNTELTASSSKSYQMVSGGTSALTVILPSASAGQYYQYGIKRHYLMSGNVVIEGGGSELIDGETNVTLSSVNASVYLISDGTQWNIF